MDRILIRLSEDTFVRHLGNDVLLWNCHTMACVVLSNIDILLECLSKDWVNVSDVLARKSDEYDVPFNQLLVDHLPVIQDLLTRSLIEGLCEGDGGGRLGCNLEGEIAEVDGRKDDWSPLGSFFEKNNIPQELHIDLTAACTERCVHCYWPHFPIMNLPFSTIEKVLNEFRELQGMSVHLSGGECMLHPRFNDVCKLCRKLELNFVVLSNLTVCNQEKIDCLKRCRPQFVNVSLYSMNPTEHDAITRVCGSWKRTMDGITNCLDAGIRVRLATPLLKRNKDAFQGLVTFAKEHNMILTGSCALIPKCDHDCANLSESCSPSEMEGVLQRYKDVFDEGWNGDATVGLNDHVCEIGRTRIYLGATGTYYPCDSMHEYSLGNAEEVSLREIWGGREIEYLRNLRNRNFEKCSICPERGYCKVCPAYNYNATGNLTEPIPNKCEIASVIHRVYGGSKC